MKRQVKLVLTYPWPDPRGAEYKQVYLVHEVINSTEWRPQQRITHEDLDKILFNCRCERLVQS